MQQNRAHKWTTLMPFSRCFDFFLHPQIPDF